MIVKLGSSSPNRRENKKYVKPPPRFTRFYMFYTSKVEQDFPDPCNGFQLNRHREKGVVSPANCAFCAVMFSKEKRRVVIP